MVGQVQYIPRNMHTVFALLCFVVVIHWLIFPYPSGLLHWHCGNLTIAPVPAKQPWWIWINTSFEFIMNNYITTTKQSTTKPCAYFLGYTVSHCRSKGMGDWLHFVGNCQTCWLSILFWISDKTSRPKISWNLERLGSCKNQISRDSQAYLRGFTMRRHMQ